MRITKVHLSSKCRDGSLVKEYTLCSPVEEKDLIILRGHGEVTVKELGGSQLFTLSSDFITLKGMIGDTVIYGTHKKEDTGAVEILMNLIFP